MTRSVSSSKKISVDKNKRRESLIQPKEIDEKEHAVFSFHINNMKNLYIDLIKMSKSWDSCYFNYEKRISSWTTSTTD